MNKLLMSFHLSISPENNFSEVPWWKLNHFNKLQPVREVNTSHYETQIPSNPPQNQIHSLYQI